MYNTLEYFSDSGITLEAILKNCLYNYYLFRNEEKDG